MDKLKNFDGGHPVTRNDFNFFQSSVFEALNNDIKSDLPTGVDKCVLWGLEDISIISDEYTHSAGSIYYQGEIYSIDELALPLTSVGGKAKFAIVIDYPANNPVAYKSGEVHYVHEIRKMKLVASDHPDGLFDYDTIARREQLRHQKSDPVGTYKDIKMAASEIATHFDEGGTWEGISDWYKGWKVDEDFGMTLVSYNPSDTDFNDADGSKKGGEKSHTLLINEIPIHKHAKGSLSVSGDGSHSHTYPGQSSANYWGSGSVGGGNFGSTGAMNLSGGGHSHSISGDTANAGSGDSHNNLPPYKVALRIIKI